jgi:polar amino acid transport system substrate-binding protein
MLSIDRRNFLVGCCTTALAADVATIANSAAAEDRVPAILRVGMANQLPYAFLDNNSKLIGQSPDVLRAALRDDGLQQIEAILTEFGALIPGLIAKRFDIICTGLFIRPARCELIAFGNPDSLSREGMLVKAGNPKNIHALADFVGNGSLRIAFLRASVDEGYAKEAKIPEAQLVSLPDLAALFAALKADRVEAVLASPVVLTAMLEKMNDPTFELVDRFVDPLSNGKPAIDYAAMGFRKDDITLRETYNKGVAKLVASGEIVEINKKWGLPATLSPTLSTPLTQQLCSG